MHLGKEKSMTEFKAVKKWNVGKATVVIKKLEPGPGEVAQQLRTLAASQRNRV